MEITDKDIFFNILNGALEGSFGLFFGSIAWGWVLLTTFKLLNYLGNKIGLARFLTEESITRFLDKIPFMSRKSKKNRPFLEPFLILFLGMSPVWLPVSWSIYTTYIDPSSPGSTIGFFLGTLGSLTGFAMYVARN